LFDDEAILSSGKMLMKLNFAEVDTKFAYFAILWTFVVRREL